MTESVRLPRLLDENRREIRRLRPTALSLSVERESASTAEITLATSDEPLPLRCLLEIYTQKGSAGLFRVCQVSSAAKGDQGQTYSLRHAIDTLRDSLWREQADFEGTMTQFLTGLLSYQTAVCWQLGNCEDTEVYVRSGINYNRLSDLLDEVRASREGYVFAYDFSTWPWTLNFVQASQQVDCEMRATRNLSDARARESQDGMCNRLYLSAHTTVKKETVPSIWSGGPNQGEDTGLVTAPEDQTTETETELYTFDDLASQAEFGVIEGTADINTLDLPTIPDPEDEDAPPVPDIAGWARDYFAERAHPQRQTTADAWEVVKKTGENWDQFDVGRVARIALPRPGFPVEAPIASVRYPDLVNQPDKVRADVGKRAPKFSETLASLREETARASAAAGGAGMGAAKAEELTHWAMVVQHILEEIEGTGIRQLWETGIVLDAEEGATIYSVYEGLGYQAASLTVAHDYIQMLVTKTGVDGLDENTTLYSMILQTAQGLQAEFFDGLNSLRSYLELTASLMRADFLDDVNSLRSYVELTASHLRAAFDDDVSSLRSYVELTASHLRAAFDDDVNSLRSYVELTASHLRAAFDDDVSSLRSYVELTASHLRAAFDDDVNSLRSYVELTASHLRAEFTDDVHSLRSYVELTASHLRAAFDDDVNSLRSYVQITAASLHSEFTNDVNSLRSTIQQTAGSISAVVSDVASIRQSGLWIHENQIASLIGAIELRDEYIQSSTGAYARRWNASTQSYEYYLAPSGYSGTRYRLEQNLHVSEGVGMKIDVREGNQTVSYGIYNQNNLTAGMLISMINGQSTALIQADKINLQGYVTANSLATEIANLNTLVNINAATTINGHLDVGAAAVFNEDVTFGDAVVGPGAQFTTLYFGANGAHDAMDAVTSIGPATESNGQITIPWSRFSGAQTPINFNIAATQTYIDGVAAAAAGASVTLSGEWIGNTVNGKYYRALTTRQNGATAEMIYSGRVCNLTPGTPTWSSDYQTVSVPVTVSDHNGESLYNGAVSFTTTDCYNAGSAAGAAAVTVSTRSGWDNGVNVITLSNNVREEVYMPSSATWTGGFNNLGYYAVSCTVGGKTYTRVFVI